MSGQPIGILGDTTLVDTVESAGADPRIVDDSDGDLQTVMADVDYVVAVGETAVSELARVSVETPILPVDAGTGVRSVPRKLVADAVVNLQTETYRTMEHPVVGVEGSFDPAAAIFDIGLFTAEPARISEFSVTWETEPVARFRADGVVASTPAGSVGYTRAADGPLVMPGSNMGPVVPIAPFTTNADHWILPLDNVTLAVERDETAVSLLLDGCVAGSIAANDPISLSCHRHVQTVIVPESLSFFADTPSHIGR